MNRGAWLAVVALCACHASAKPKEDSMAGARPESLNQTELQEAVQRFSADLSSRLSDASQPLLESSDVALREATVRRALLYQSSLLDIATGPRPEINLLDLSVFLGLSRAVFERHWLRQLGESSRPMLVAMQESQAQLDELLARLLSADELRWLRARIDEWLEANPDRVNVEGVRFSEFSRFAGNLAGDDSKSGGLVGSMKKATKTADEAVLVAERMRFLASRLPYVLRLQARLGASDVTSDLVARLKETELELAKLEQVRPLVGDLTKLSEETRRAVQEARATLTELQPFLERLPRHEQLGTTLSSAERIGDKSLQVLDRLSHVLEQTDALLPKDAARTAATVETQVEHLMRKGALYLVLVGIAWSLLFWGGYVAANALNRAGRAPRAPTSRRFVHLKPRT
jgi:hypothetical protein